MLPDGRYDVIVVDADGVGEDAEVTRLELTVLSGEHKGDVVTVRAAGGVLPDPLDLLGVPGTLVVSDGVPRFTAEP